MIKTLGQAAENLKSIVYIFGIRINDSILCLLCYLIKIAPNMCFPARIYNTLTQGILNSDSFP